MTLRSGTPVTDNVILVEEIGSGAMGTVWLAEHTTLETRVAVKFISEELVQSRPDSVERFRHEATAAAKIKSPHVVQMLDHGVMDDGTPYLVMELLEGQSLHERILERGPLSLEDTAVIVSQTSRALAAAHALGVIHRDIKPHNIFLVEMHGELFVKVLDFGIAKKLDVSEELTEPGTIVGTPHYVCRDLILGGLYRDVDKHVDMWSLAVVAYKCLTGILPFEGTTLNQICGALAAGKFDPPSTHRPELSPRVDAWFSRALHPDKSERFETAGELSRRFRALLGDEENDDEPVTGVEPPSLEPAGATRAGRWPLLVVVVLGLAVGALIVFGLVAPSRSLQVLAPLAFEATTPSVSVRAPPPPPPAPPAADPRSISEAARERIGSAPGAPGEGEVAVPAGIVWLGCHDETDVECSADQIPGHEVFVDAFFIDRHEVRVSDYGRCVVAGECDDRRVKGYVRKGKLVPSTRCNWQQPGRAKDPMNCVSHPQAAAYCAFLGKRLPTEAEWERAARGDDRRLFPWGDSAASCILTVMAEEGDEGCGRDSSWPVGSKAKDESPFGALDMAGNVREWVADWYDAEAYREGPVENPSGPDEGSLRVARGGSWGRIGPSYMRVSVREARPPATRSAYVGFRCARTP